MRLPSIHNLKWLHQQSTQLLIVKCLQELKSGDQTNQSDGLLAGSVLNLKQIYYIVI